MIVVCFNWIFTLGRFDVHFSMFTMIRYNAATRKGHLGAMLIIFGYLNHHMKLKITCDTCFLEDHEKFV